MKRIQWIDAARGIGVALVVLGHLSKVYEGIGQWIYSFHMPLFFVISGILFFQKKEYNKNIKCFVLGRLRSLAFPYISLSVLNILYDLVLHGVEHAKEYIIDTITLNGILALWFLPALFFAEILLFVWHKCFYRSRSIGCIIIILMIILTSTYSCFGFNYTDFNGGMKYLVLFCTILCRAIYGFIFLLVGGFGIRIYSFVSKRTYLKGKYIIYLFVVISCGVINLCLYRFNGVLLSSCITGNPLLFYVNSISGTCFIIGITYLLNNHLRLLEFYGINSIIIFSTHLNFGFVSLATKLWKLPFCELIATFVIVMTIETVLAWVVSKYLGFIVSFNKFKKVIKIKEKNS